MDVCSQSGQSHPEALLMRARLRRKQGTRVQCAVRGLERVLVCLRLCIILRIYTLYSQLVFKALPSPSPCPIHIFGSSWGGGSPQNSQRLEASVDPQPGP